VGFTQDPCGIVMKLYTMSLYDMLFVKKLLSDDKTALTFGKEIASAMAALHNLNITHRDLKTSNY